MALFLGRFRHSTPSLINITFCIEQEIHAT
jgi:hypothetical protein